MRIAFVLAVWGEMSVPVILGDLAACLRPQGFGFIVLARRRTRLEPARRSEDGFVVHRVGWVAPRGLAWLESAVNAVVVPWQTRAVLRAERPDAVHYHFSGVDWNLVSLLPPLRAPLFVTFHGFLGGGGAPLWEFLCAAVIRRAARLSAVSQAVAGQVARFYPRARGRIETIRSGIDLSLFQGEDHVEPPERPYLLSVARLAPYKGHDLLLFAFLDLVRRGAEVDLVLCGPEDDAGHVRGLVRALGLEGRVRLCGELPRREVARLLRGCEFAVLASRDGESFPLANLETLAAGKTLVATGASGIVEALEHEHNALLFPARDIGALGAAMRRLLEDRGLRARLERGAARSAQAFSREAMAEAYRSWYEARS